MRPKEFHLTALNLGKDGTTEGDWRSSVSRSFYAAFLEVREILREKVGVSLLRPGGRSILTSQKSVIDLLRKSNNGSIKSLGDLLGDLQTDRHDSDYNLRLQITKRNAEDALVGVGEIYKQIEQITPDVLAHDVEVSLRQ
jgi:uncharacterized protein (UPF0332 family)